jgi:hypothetical protein
MLTGLVLFVVPSAWAQDVLPFPEPPMGGSVGPTMQESVHKWRQQPRHLPEDAPSIWMASTFGPRTPWVATPPDIANWDPEQDEWQLFDTRSDYSLMNDLASENPEKLEEMKALFLQAAKERRCPSVEASTPCSIPRR